MARVLLGLLLALAVSAHAQTVLRSLQVSDPRDYGYHLGDQIERRIILELNHPYRLDNSKLPEPGLLNHWFELAGLELRETELNGGTRYSLTVRYQIMNIRTERQALTIPALMLLARTDDHDPLGFRVPPLVLNVAAVSSMQADNARVQAAMEPAAIDLSIYRWSVLAASGLLLSAGLGWLILQGYVPGLRPSTRPFAQAYRQLRRQTPNTAQARRIVHQAFDQTAGRTIFASELPRLWGEQPWLIPQKTAIETFFVDSERFFYQPEQENTLVAVDLLALCRACRRLERAR